MSANLSSNIHAERSKDADNQEPKRTIGERVSHNFREFVAMFLYIWVVFGLFTYYKAMVLTQNHIPFGAIGIAFFNALVLAKVMLVAEDLRVGTRFRKRAPIFPTLHKSLLFAIIFMFFNLAENIVTGLWKGKTIANSIPEVWKGGLGEVVTAGLIVTVALMPFFAFRELSLVMGKGVLGALFLKGHVDNRGMEDRSRAA